MARWRLTASHYLHLQEETKWEYTEVDRSNGRQKRTQYVVPRLLDINDPADWTEKMLGMDGKPVEGYINVCDGNSPERGDLIYKGKPTPDMLPLDEAAEKITSQYRDAWNFAADAEPGSFSQNLIDNFQKQLSEVQANLKPQATEIPGMADFMASMTAIMAKQTELIAEMAKGRRA